MLVKERAHQKRETESRSLICIRPARPSDRDDIYRLAEETGPGFTSLKPDLDYVDSRLEKVRASFAGERDITQSRDYLLVAESADHPHLLGCCSVKTRDHDDAHFLNYEYHPDTEAGWLKRTRKLNDACEVGSLFVSTDARGLGLGKMLSQARYLLIAAQPDHFPQTVMAELRGVANQDDRDPPLWEALGQNLYNLSFEEADTLVAEGNDAFVRDLTPERKIRFSELTHAAIAALNQCHPEGRAALAMLKKDGFRESGIVDLFDGGPIVVAKQEDIRTIRDSRCAELTETLSRLRGRKILASNNRFANFRCTKSNIPEETSLLPAENTLFDLLMISASDKIRYCEMV